MVTPASSRAREWTPVVAIIAIAAVLRCWQLSWGLPSLYEEAMPVRISMKFWNWGQPGVNFNPGFYIYPAFTFYLQFALQSLALGIGKLFGVYSGIEAFRVATESDWTLFTTIGRYTTVAFDLGTIFLIYILGRDYFNRSTGLLAALFVAVNPLHIREAHIVNVDTPITFFFVLALYCMLRAISLRTWSKFIATGCVIGLASATKYNGGFLGLTFTLLLLITPANGRNFFRKLELPKLLIAGLASITVFILLNPYIILNFSEFTADFGRVRYHMASGHLGVLKDVNPWNGYLYEMFPQILGWPLLGITLASCIWYAVRRSYISTALIILALTYLIIIGGWSMRAERYIFPVVPFFLLMSAGFLIELFVATRRTIKNATPAISAGVVLVLTAIAQPVIASTTYLHELGKPDTRTIARSWLLAHTDQRSAIAMGPTGIELPDTVHYFDLPFDATESDRLMDLYQLPFYDDFDYIVCTDYDFGRYKSEPNRFGGYLSFLDSLKAHSRLEMETGPGTERTGPAIWIFRPHHTGADTVSAESLGKIDGVRNEEYIGKFTTTLGKALIGKGAYAKGAQFLRRALQSDSSDLEIRKTLTIAYLVTGKFNDAFRESENYLAVDSANAEMFEVNGDVLSNLGRPAEAMANYSRAISIDPQRTSSYSSLADLLIRQNEPVQAAQVLEQLVSVLPPNDPSIDDLRAKISQFRKHN